MKRIFWRWIPAVALMGLIFVLSSQSNPPTPFRFAHADKVVHVALYGALCAALLLPGLSPLQAGAAAALYGATDELHQRWVPGREASMGDWLADLAGAATVAAAVWTCRRYRHY